MFSILGLILADCIFKEICLFHVGQHSCGYTIHSVWWIVLKISIIYRENLQHSPPLSQIMQSVFLILGNPSGRNISGAMVEPRLGKKHFTGHRICIRELF